MVSRRIFLVYQLIVNNSKKNTLNFSSFFLKKITYSKPHHLVDNHKYF